MLSFAEYLHVNKTEEGLQNILLSLTFLMPKVANLLRGEFGGYANSKNVFGENQLKLDVLTNTLFVEELQKNSYVSSIASEEMDSEVEGSSLSGYSVAFDPLDGSSLVDSNLSVGSIFGIYKGKGFVGRKGNEQVAALITVYGPQLSFFVSCGKGVSHFIFDFEKKNFYLHKENIILADNLKMFAPGNLRACSTEKWYLDLFEHWVRNGYTLRYTGGMVPDINQILVKGGGIFTYPGYKEQPNGKLRLLYECAPMAFLIEKARGKATNGKVDILDLKIESLDQRTPIFLGSSKEVKLVKSFMN